MSIGGFVKYQGRSRTIEFISLETENRPNCNIPHFPETVVDHETVQSEIGLITCGGLNSNNDGSNRCYRLESNYSWASFPSMHERRSKFAMYDAGGYLFAFGGRDNASTSLEWIHLTDGEKWEKEALPFTISDHCITKFNDTHLIATGGWLSQNKRIEVI